MAQLILLTTPLAAQNKGGEQVAVGPGAVTITAEDVERYVAAKNLTLQERQSKVPLTATNAKRVVEQVMRTEIFTRQALSLGLVTEQEMAAVAELASNTLAAERYIDHAVGTRLADIDWQLVAREYYRANPKEFTRPAQVRVRHVLIKPTNGWGDAVLRAEALRERLIAGEDAEQLARTYSEDSSAAANGGDLGFFGRGKMFPTFESAAFAMEIGEVSELVVTTFGVHVMVLLDRKDAELAPYAEVQAQLVSTLKGRRWSDEERNVLLDALRDDRQEYAVDINQAALDALINAK